MTMPDTPARPELPPLVLLLRQQPQHVQDAAQAYALNFAALYADWARADERRKTIDAMTSRKEPAT